jgi:magnesium transporter
MTSLSETVAGAPTSDTLRMRLIYRSGSGAIDLHYPESKIPEALADPDGTLWLDIEDLQGRNVAQVEALFRDVFQFHPLAIEDALSEANVPKVDDWERYLYVVFHAIDFDPDTDDLRLHELDVFLGRNFLVTYRTEPMPIVERVRTLCDRDADNKLKRRPDHVLYHLLDLGVAEHLAAIEHLDDAIDTANDEIFENPTSQTLHDILRIKRTVSQMHRVIAPQREVANRLARDMYRQIGERDRVYFRDVYDSLVRLHDLTESVRDLVSGALETYLSVTANRTNDIMKTLTIVTVLFLPLNFIVGFFGMNFFGDNIHLDDWGSPHAPIFALGCLSMLGSAVGIWFWGHKRGWY